MYSRIPIVLSALALLVLGACGDSSRNQPSSKSASSGSAAATSVADIRYESTLGQGIHFYRPGYPRFVRSVEGVSIHEQWGRWSDGSTVRITFTNALPRQFQLQVTGAAFGPNIGEPVKVTIGGVTKTLTFVTPLGQPPQVATAAFSLDRDANILEMSVPKPTVPGGADGRSIGIALIEIRFVQ